MTQPEPSTVDADDEQTTRAAITRGTMEYTVEADVTLVHSEGVEEVEPFRATVEADSTEDAIDAYRRVARERLVDAGTFADIQCPPFPGYGDYRFVEE
ncbi:hypothetical protein ACFPYI_13360 [Halomarina salina]|uniref:Uncharacterized protein n=1 Tax=Halomarina salina TaxID=1872699 RepID=A0ABD5RPG2_9EURY|nr:hypothetical protein [Halomarina salina]